MGTAPIKSTHEAKLERPTHAQVSWNHELISRTTDITGEAEQIDKCLAIIREQKFNEKRSLSNYVS